VELPTSALLARLERHGIAADRPHLEAMEQQFAGAVQQAVKEAHAAVGHEFNLGSPKQLQEVLFGELGLPRTKKTKTGYTTDADALAWLAAQTEHELPVIMLRHREQAKLRVTVEGLIKTIGADGRIHTTFSQTVAATGRLSSTDPNLQNVPVRTDEGRAIRRGFVVGEGYESLMTADYSQIEMRIMAHLSEDAGLIEAFTSGEDLHTTVASQVFGVERGAVDPEMRRKIKAMSYGLAYGLSAFGLSQQLNIEAAEARGLMDTFFERFGGVRDYLQRAVVEARATGYTTTASAVRWPSGWRSTPPSRAPRPTSSRSPCSTWTGPSAKPVSPPGCCSRSTTKSSWRSPRGSARRWRRCCAVRCRPPSTCARRWTSPWA
jgi:DNA polymerase-1